MRKTFLVALREYKENVRTKTFWISISVFPVLLVVSILVPIWLEGTKDVRRYAVIDHSGWLLEAVDARATMPDLEAVFRTTVERYREGGESFEQLPEVLRLLAPALAELTDAQLETSARAVAATAGPEGLASILVELPEEATTAICEFHASIRDWWQNLPPQEAKEFGSGLSKSRYARVDVPGSAERQQEKVNEMLADNQLFAYFVIGPDPLVDSDGCKYISNNLTDDNLRRWFGWLATEEVRGRRIADEGIDPDVAEHIQAPLLFEEKTLSKTGQEEEVQTQDTVRQWAPVVFVYILWLSVFMIGQMLLTNTIEEKSNRTIEVLLSSVSPMQIMGGKIGGISAIGLTVLSSWVVFFWIVVKSLPHFVKEMPDIDLAVILSEPIYLTSFLVYFLLGYLLYGSALAGVGSVFNNLKEAQNLMMTVMIFMIIPLLSMTHIGQDPNGTLAKVLSFIPPFTPFVMMNRAAGPPAMWEYVLTTAMLLVSIALAMWGAAKIFRIGILLTGKPPSLFEILKWIKAPVGTLPVRKEE